MKTVVNKALAASALFLPALAPAHDGHGLTGLHWHASDTWGFVVVVALAAAAVWISRGK